MWNEKYESAAFGEQNVYVSYEMGLNINKKKLWTLHKIAESNRYNRIHQYILIVNMFTNSVVRTEWNNRIKKTIR